MNDARRSGLVVPMPELEAAVGALRAEWDPLARLGARAHVTVLFPFAAPAHVDDALLASRIPPRRSRRSRGRWPRSSRSTRLTGVSSPT